MGVKIPVAIFMMNKTNITPSNEKKNTTNEYISSLSRK
jgi:hypothetical protein